MRIFFLLFFILFILLNLHLLRNVSNIFVGVILVIYFFLFMSTLLNLNSLRWSRKNKVFIFYLLFMLCGIGVIIISIPNSDLNSFAVGISRFLIVFPIGIFAFLFIKSEHDVSKIIFAYMVIVAIGCLTVPLQHIIGHISWFVEPSSRAGLVRYGSLFGSLTAVGIVGGIGLTITLLSNYKIVTKIILIIPIISGLLLSLQKAAFVNLVLSFAIFFLLKRGAKIKTLKQIISSTILVVLVILLTIWYFPDTGSFIISFIDKNVGISLADTTKRCYDETIIVSIVNRTIDFPKSLLNEHGKAVLFTGVGFKGMGGTLGQKARMAHNGFFDILFSGGLLYFIVTIMLLGYLFRNLRLLLTFATRTNDSVMYYNVRIFNGIFIIIIVNMLGAGMLFQPNTGVIFWTMVGVVSGYYYKKFHNYKHYKPIY